MLKAEELSISFNNTPIITSLTHTFKEGAVTAIIGESGVGKTTLIDLLAGLKKPSGGKVVRDAERISYVFQEPRLFDWMTAKQNVSEVSTTETADRLLSLMGLSDSADKYPSELSGGMKQRVSIARALAYDPELIFLDEPFKGLDKERRKEISDILFNTLKGKTVILVTHDDADLEYADEIYSLTSTPQSRLTEVKSYNRETE